MQQPARPTLFHSPRFPVAIALPFATASLGAPNTEPDRTLVIVEASIARMAVVPRRTHRFVAPALAVLAVLADSTPARPTRLRDGCTISAADRERAPGSKDVLDAYVNGRVGVAKCH